MVAARTAAPQSSRTRPHAHAGQRRKGSAATVRSLAPAVALRSMVPYVMELPRIGRSAWLWAAGRAVTYGVPAIRPGFQRERAFRESLEQERGHQRMLYANAFQWFAWRPSETCSGPDAKGRYLAPPPADLRASPRLNASIVTDLSIVGLMGDRPHKNTLPIYGTNPT